MYWFIATVVLIIFGAMQAWLTIRGFGPPSPPELMEPYHRAERVMIGTPQVVLEAYRRAVEATSGMHIYQFSDSDIFVDARPSIFVMDGDYGSAMRVAVRPVHEGATLVTVESMPKTTWISGIVSVDGAFAAKERVLRMKAKRLGGIDEKL